ncbi:hypothetical protein NQ317_018980 [Molorchus minor]|uniref:Uncharacterized protein n=1 Tax=Molorchus minor TaxID=1323400 RepID=A0ABQ9ITZ3_9CUCU|nr:hypothetical protein NQ317_018980 [Molorchus minor]
MEVLGFSLTLRSLGSVFSLKWCSSGFGLLKASQCSQFVNFKSFSGEIQAACEANKARKPYPKNELLAYFAEKFQKVKSST